MIMIIIIFLRVIIYVLYCIIFLGILPKDVYIPLKKYIPLLPTQTRASFISLGILGNPFSINCGSV